MQDSVAHSHCLQPSALSSKKCPSLHTAVAVGSACRVLLAVCRTWCSTRYPRRAWARQHISALRLHEVKGIVHMTQVGFLQHVACFAVPDSASSCFPASVLPCSWSAIQLLKERVFPVERAPHAAPMQHCCFACAPCCPSKCPRVWCCREGGCVELRRDAVLHAGGAVPVCG